MKSKIYLVVSLAIFSTTGLQSVAQGTAFTYQGRLNANGTAASGLYDFRFRLDADAQGNTILGTVLTNAIPVTNGLFITTLDFGPGYFTGSNYWLEVDVKTNAAATYTALAPLQPLTATPYAIFAQTASNVSGTISASQLSGTLPLAQIPAGVVTNNDPGVTVSNLTVGGSLTLPANSTTIFAGANPLLYQDGAFNFYAGVKAGLVPPAIGSGDNTAVGYEAFENATAGADNTAVGYTALQSNSGANNTAIGSQALQANGIGRYNTAAGALALNISTGDHNTADGYYSLSGNYAGSFNTANGSYALANNRNGNYNTASGYESLNSGTGNPNGSYNTADGYQSLYNSGSGNNNTAIGVTALNLLTAGSYNIALGSGAGSVLTTGSSNIDIGNPGVAGDVNFIRIGTSQTQTYLAGVINGNGGGLTNLNLSQPAAGTLPLSSLPAGVVTNNASAVAFNDLTLSGALSLPTLNSIIYSGNNSLIYADNKFNFYAGVEAGVISTPGEANTAIGSLAMGRSTNEDGIVAVGYEALLNDNAGTVTHSGPITFVTSGASTAIGYQAMLANLSGTQDTAIGYQAMENSTNDNDLVAIGYQALQNDNALTNAGGLNNEGGLVNGGGFYSQFLNRNNDDFMYTSGENTAVGFQSLQQNMGGTDNTADGFLAMSANVNGYEDTAMGSGALAYGTGGHCDTAVGFGALQQNQGNNNTALGYQALLDNGAGSENTAVGESALANNVGSHNTALGGQALCNSVYLYNVGEYFQNNNGSNNVAVGFQAGANFTNSESDNIDIGNAGAAGESKVVRLGSDQTQTFLAGTVYANNVQLTSDRNAKENFIPIDSGDILTKVAALPLTQWNYKDTKTDRHIGPMAQDFRAAFQLGDDDKHIAVVDEGGVALAAIQGLNQKLETRSQELEVKSDRLEKENAELKQELAELRGMVQQIAQSRK